MVGVVTALFAFCGHGATFEKPGLLGAADGIHLTKWGKRVFANKLAKLTMRALSWTSWGRGWSFELQKSLGLLMCWEPTGKHL